MWQLGRCGGVSLGDQTKRGHHRIVLFDPVQLGERLEIDAVQFGFVDDALFVDEDLGTQHQDLVQRDRGDGREWCVLSR